jgi:S-adenosylmethionine-dependent methyltransferase
MLEAIPTLSERPLRVAEIGCGDGRIAQLLAGLGHHVTACDASADMLTRAEGRCLENDLIRFVNLPLQHATPEALGGEFDVVVCHAVLEWLTDPEAAIATLVRLLRPAGTLSLLFYTRNASRLRQVAEGDIDRILAGPDARSPGRSNPLDPVAVAEWVTSSGVNVRSRSGIRIVHEFLREPPDAASLQRVIAVERALSRREPFDMLGRHIHLVGERVS